jgi:hypothetical protein
MDNNEQRGTQRPPIRDWSTMTSSATPCADRTRARRRGLALVSAITLSAGAAGLVGTAGLASTLASAGSARTSVSAVSAVRSTSTRSSSQPQAVVAPTTTSNAPVATTGGS